jgi:hypothetical protein
MEAKKPADVAPTLEEGDIISIPNYKNDLRVSLVGLDVGMIGVEFADEDKRTSANKSLMINENSGRVYLTAGTADKGEVSEISVR